MDASERAVVRAEVGAAAAMLVAAFAAHDRDAYFAAFAADARFVFHTSPHVLESRAAYEAEWRRWEAEGFHVDGCDTTETKIVPLGRDVAVLTHAVRTRLAGEAAPLRERETIVFRREADGTWLAVHEHLSPDPGAADPG